MMNAITPERMVELLSGARIGAQVFVSYLAGGKTTDAAVVAAERASGEGIPRRWFTGTIQRVWKTKKGEVVFSAFVRERDAADGTEGAFRTFNPALGQLLTLEVLAPGEGEEIRV